MKIWILKEGEPLPCDEDPRLMRMGMLAEYLAKQGHQVVWWSTTFAHGSKTYRCMEQRELDIKENEKLILLHSKVSYQKNVSLSRIRYHNRLAREFVYNIKKYEKPDVILCSYPTVQFAKEALKYGKKNSIPVILDVRDLWPDIFDRAFPDKLKWLAHIALIPLQVQAKRTFRKADAIVGITPEHLRWGLKKAGRKKGYFDKVIYIGYKPDSWKNEEERAAAIMGWEKYGITDKTWNICFFSTLSKSSLDLETCIRAVIELTQKYPDIRLVVGGDGDGLTQYKKAASGNPNIIFSGWLGNTQIHGLMELSKIGLYPMRNLPDFKNSFTNKLVGYMASELAIISAPKGFSKSYIEKYDMGLVYEENDVKSCYKALEKMYLNEELRLRMAKNAYQRFQAEFHSDIVNNQFEDLMSELIVR